jgi:hypothetical protein
MLPGHELKAYLPGGASGGILPARLADVPLDFDTLQPHGCFIGSAAIVLSEPARPHGRRGAQPDAFFEHELRPVHALPRRHRQGAHADGRRPLGRAAAGRPVAGDARRVDLRPGAGGAQPGGLCRALLCDDEVGAA